MDIVGGCDGLSIGITVGRIVSSVLDGASVGDGIGLLGAAPGMH